MPIHPDDYKATGLAWHFEADEAIPFYLMPDCHLARHVGLTFQPLVGHHMANHAKRKDTKGSLTKLTTFFWPMQLMKNVTKYSIP